MAPLTSAVLFGMGIVVIILAFLALTTYNDVVALRRRIDRAWANIEVALRQRHDELPNLVAAVSGVMTFERGVLEEVARQRARYQPSAPPPEQAATADATSAAVRSLLAVVENYPELKSAANVLALQGEIERLEQLIAGRRELYNDQVYRYNTTIQQVPAVVLVPLFGWRPIDFFATTAESIVRPEAGLQLS